jgi:hypothetical protein
MSRILSLSIIVVLSLLPVVTSAAPANKQRTAARWHGYGFLPGYRQPPNEAVPVYGVNRPRGGPYYVPSYWYGGERYYFGQPGFYRGRYNGGSFGPCWTWTPIGRAWNCG